MDTVLADAFRSRFVPLKHVFVTILANFKQSSSWDLWNDHRRNFITDSCKCFTRWQDLLGSDPDALAYAHLEVKNYLSDMVTAPFSTFGLPEAREEIAPPTIEPQQCHSSRRHIFQHYLHPPFSICH